MRTLKILRIFALNTIGAVMTLIFGPPTNDLKKQTKKLEKLSDNLSTDAHEMGLNGIVSIQNILNQFHAACKKATDSVLESIIEMRTAIDAELSQVEKHLTLSDKDRKELWLNKLWPSYQERFVPHYQKHEAARRRRHKAIKKARRIQAWLRKHEGPEVPGFLDKSWLGLIVAILIFVLEISFSLPIFEGFGFKFGGAIICSLGFSSVLLLSSELTSYYYKKSKRGFIICLILGLMTLMFLIVLRVISGGEHLFLTSVGLSILFGISVALAIRRNKYKEWLIKKDIDETSTPLLNSIDAIMNEAKASAIRIKREFEDLAEIKTIEEKNDLLARHIKLQGDKQKNEQAEKHVRSHIEDLRIQKTAVLIQSHSEGLSERTDQNDAEQGQGGMKGWGNVAFTLLLAIVLTFTSACDPKTPENSHWEHTMFDSSLSMEKEKMEQPDKLTKSIFTRTSIDNPGFKALKVKTSYNAIGDSIMPQIRGGNTLHIPSLLNRDRNATKNQIKAYKETLNRDMNDFQKSLPEANNTNQYYVLSYILNQMSRSDYTNKTITIVGDGVEDGLILDFTDYLDNPEGLMADYANLRLSMLKAVPLENDYSGIKVIFLYPDGDTSSLSLQCRRFWKRFLSELSIEAQFFPNL